MNDPDLAFITEIIKKLERDIDEEFLNTNFATLREKKAFLTKVQSLLGAYGAEIRNATIEEIGREWLSSENLAKTALNSLPTNLFNNPNNDVLKALVTLESIKDEVGAEIDLLFLNSRSKLIQSFNLLESNLKRSVMAEVASGSITGNPMIEIGARIEKELKKSGITKFTLLDKNGNIRNYSVEYKAREYAQHGIISSRMQATIKMAVSMGYDLVKIDDHAGSVIPISPMCKPHNGKTVSITGMTKGYPKLESVMWDGRYKYGSGISHPWCRHSLTIYIPTSVQFD